MSKFKVGQAVRFVGPEQYREFTPQRCYMVDKVLANDRVEISNDDGSPVSVPSEWVEGTESNMTLSELNNAIIMWAADRGIIRHSTAYAQAIKTAEEVRELIQASVVMESDDDLDLGDMMDNLTFCQNVEEIVDAVGDVYVTLVVGAMCYSNLTGSAYSPPGVVTPSSVKNPIEALQKCLVMLGASSVGGRSDYWTINATMMSYLAQIAGTDDIPGQANDGLGLTGCVAHAYNEIKDRKGYLRPDGVFVKEEQV